MGKFFDDTMQGLLEATAINKGEVPLVAKENMPALTLIATEKEKKLIDELVQLRKQANISQAELARRTGNKQQAISRIESKEHSPSLKLFYCMICALGYDIKIVKGNQI